VLVSLIASSYLAELLGRVDRFAVTVLAADQRVLAGRFAASGRPGARLLLDGVPHQRGTLSGALIPAGGLAALECEATQRVVAGDHLLVIARVLDVPYLAENGQPLIRFRGKYPPLSPGSPALSGPARPRYPARHTRPARHGFPANSHLTQRPKRRTKLHQLDVPIKA
jgi:flavin reductase (DIM6/NTAB) family NADH-FMN oxidoreductase RutF